MFIPPGLLLGREYGLLTSVLIGAIFPLSETEPILS